MPTWMTVEQAKEWAMKAEDTRRGLYPLATVTAAARRITTKETDGNRPRTNMPKPQSWQEEAWDMFNLVGELHFLMTTLANRIAAGALYVGEVERDEPSAEPIQSTDQRVQAVLSRFGGNQAGRSQIIARMALNLLVAGEGWFLGIDEEALNAVAGEGPSASTPGGGSITVPLPSRPAVADPARQEWRTLSISELTSSMNDGSIEATLEDETKIAAKLSDVDLIRVWRPHGRRAWQADSAVQASLPTLREIVGLTMQVAAQVDSRLAGAGMLAVKESVVKALRIGLNLPPESLVNPMVESLIEHMMTPLQNRDSASAVVPLVVTYPDEVENPITHISFATPLDAQIPALRDGAIRRLALGMDAPPEILTGTAAANHWGAWLVNEDTVTIHIEPQLALICDALTTQYLWPALVADGMTEEDAQGYVVWYSVDHMVVRPNQFEEATQLFERGAIDLDTLRRAGGYDTSDAPEEVAQTDEDIREEAVKLAVELVREAPSLISAPGLQQIVAQIEAVMRGEEVEVAQPSTTPPEAEEPEDEEPPAGELPTGPTTDGPPDVGNPDTIAADGGVR